MKSFKFKKQASVISTLKEPPKAKKKKFNWQRLTYALLLAGIAFYVGKKVYIGVAKVRGEGQVELKKQAVTFTNDIELMSILVAEGDTVKQGDTLFWYKNEMDEDGGVALANINQPVDWILRERLHVQKDIAIKKIKRSRFAKELKFKQDELQHQKELVLLGVNNIESKLTSIQEEILIMKAEQKALNNEIYYLKKYLAQLNSQEKEIQSIEIGKAQQVNQTAFYVAQMDGIIGQINFNNNEVCYEKEDVMTIHKMDEISIKGYFDPEEVQYIQRGGKVEVLFPNGGRGTGIIHNFYVSTYALPAEFQKKYEPVERNVVVDIVPVNELEAERWSRFYKMQVKIETPRFKNLPKVLAMNKE